MTTSPTALAAAASPQAIAPLPAMPGRWYPWAALTRGLVYHGGAAAEAGVIRSEAVGGWISAQPKFGLWLAD
jgi:hypothetical protein